MTQRLLRITVKVICPRCGAVPDRQTIEDRFRARHPLLPCGKCGAVHRKTDWMQLPIDPNPVVL
jgi:uncharacterized Zn finger protein